MPNLKASIKDLRKSKRRTAENLRLKKRYKKTVKDLNKQIDNGDTKETPKTLSKTYKLLDKAAKRNLLKKNNVARKKSRLTKRVNKVISNPAEDVKNTKQGT